MSGNKISEPKEPEYIPNIYGMGKDELNKLTLIQSKTLAKYKF